MAKTRVSSFFFTINSNKSINKNKISEEDEKKFTIIMDVINKNFREFLLDKKNPENLNNIEKLEVSENIETGAKRGFLHTHFFIHVYHHGLMQINLIKLRAFLREAWPNYYMSPIKGLNDESESIKLYSEKGKKK